MEYKVFEKEKGKDNEIVWNIGARCCLLQKVNTGQENIICYLIDLVMSDFDHQHGKI